MESEHFAELNELGAGHWWFATRFEVVWRLAREAAAKAPRRCVDLGCGTGTFLGWLAEEKGLPPSCLLGLEAADAGLAATERRGIPVARFDLGNPDLAGMLREPPDVFSMLDVLEHLADPVSTLRAAYAASKPGTLMLVTVPALPSLWSKWDVRLGHYRRYTRSMLSRELTAGGWEPVKVQYLFAAMVLPGLVRRLRSRSQREGDRGFPVVTTTLNAILKAWCLAEARLGSLLPLGTSLAAVALRKA